MIESNLHIVYNRNVKEKILQINDVDQHWKEFTSGIDIWLLQTYCLLRNYYPDITISAEPRKERINIIHGGSLSKDIPIAGFYFVNARADYPAAYWCNFEIVQNKIQESHRAKYITHWSQPGLIKRNNKRHGLENVAFMGNPEQNILRKFPVFDDLASMGINYINLDREKWNDYSNIDVVLGIRQFGSTHIYPNKPPSKLINAWWAEVPLIAGGDSAFSQIGVPNEDYVRVFSYDDLLEKILFLKDNPGYYDQIIKNGISKRKHYTRENILKEWIEVFQNNIFPDFEAWKRNRGPKKLIDTQSRNLIRLYQQVIIKAKTDLNLWKKFVK